MTDPQSADPKATRVLTFELTKARVMDMEDPISGYLAFRDECFRRGAVSIATEDDSMRQLTRVLVEVPCDLLTGFEAFSLAKDAETHGNTQNGPEAAQIEI